jgi:hypothetical protein
MNVYPMLELSGSIVARSRKAAGICPFGTAKLCGMRRAQLGVLGPKLALDSSDEVTWISRSLPPKNQSLSSMKFASLH